MELGSQERKRENQTLYNFTIKSAPNTIETAYTLINQKWLVPEHNPKKQEDQWTARVPSDLSGIK